MEVVTTCPLCGGENYKQHIDCKDFTLSQEIFSIVKCSGCSFLFTNPRPGENEIGVYYKSDDYISHTGTSKGLINKLYHWVRNYTLKGKLKLIKQHHSAAKSILDYGAGTGEFLSVMRANGFEVTGLEPSTEARARAKEVSGIDLRDNSELPVLSANTYDVITLWHVLEHVHRIGETLHELNRVLTDDGLLLIAVPNSASFDAHHYKTYWAAYDVPRHLYHFQVETMEKLLLKYGFTVEKVLPMWFDSFYVSMLSEKYANGNAKSTGIAGLFSAFYYGFTSNLKGMIDKRNFSSLMYVVRKK